MRLDGKTVLVTGAGGGIGGAIAERLAAAGARICATDVDAAAARATLERCGDGEAHALDITDEAAFDALVDDVDRRHGLDVIINNAGIAFQTSLLTTATPAFRKILEVNVIGVFIGMRAAARVMRLRGTRGRIVNISSVAGLRGSTGRTAYGASKAAVINMTQVAAVELGPSGITVNAVAPGPVETAMVRAMHSPATREGWSRHLPQKRYAQPEEIAGACLYLASEEASYTTGQVLAVDGGFVGGGLIFDIENEG